MMSGSFFAQCWVSHTLSFEGVLAQWEAGNFDQIRPAGALPSGGLGAVIWKRGGAKQSKLVGSYFVDASSSLMTPR